MRKYLLGTIFCLVAGAASAQQMTAVAVSPDGSTVLAAGDNRGLYTIDSESLEVTHRRYITGQVRWLEYSADGETVFMRTDDREFSARAARSFKSLYTMEDINAVSYAPEADRIALLESNYDGGVLHVLTASTGKVVTRIEFPDIRTEMVALAPDGGSAILLTSSSRSDSEESESPSSDLKGYERSLFRQQHDGYVSTIVAVDLASGDFSDVETFYRVSFPGQVRMLDGRMAIVNGTGDTALLSGDGTTDLLNLGSNYVAYGRISDDGETILLTGGTELAFHPLTATGAGEAGRSLDAGRIDGPSERVTAADEAADGTVYMVTSAYRIWKVAPDSVEVEARPVF